MLNKGFSLIELMIVVAIAGGTTFYGGPMIMNMLAKSKQGEAKNNLLRIKTLQFVYSAEYGRFWYDKGNNDNGISPLCYSKDTKQVNGLGFMPEGDYYTYQTGAGGEDKIRFNFIGVARAKTVSSIKKRPGGSLHPTYLDTWLINDGGDICPRYDSVRDLMGCKRGEWGSGYQPLRDSITNLSTPILCR